MRRVGPGSSGRRGRSAGPLSDQALVDAIRAGSEEHFSILYERYFPRIYAFVYRRNFSHADAEEVVQETFTSAFCSLGRYEGQSSLLAWIYGIARNCANSHIRRASSRRDRMEDYQQRHAGSMAGDTINRAESPDAFVSFYGYGDALRRGLSAAGEWQTEIFVMRHLQNLSIPEIAERTDRSHDAIRSSLHRTKRIFFEAAGGAA